MTMLKQVAKAICKSRTCEGINCCQWPCNGGRWHDHHQQIGVCRVEEGRYDDAARLAIEAMRVPTDGMYAAYLCEELWRDLNSVKVLSLWIDAALSEGK